MPVLCALVDLADGESRGFGDVFLVRSGGQVFAYENSCPHLGLPLEWSADQFLSQDRAHIVCGTHAALFRIETGECVRGPCRGETLRAVPCRIMDGAVVIDGPLALRPGPGSMLQTDGEG